ncbi:hypothetical protein IAR55_001138 [Kwoniella newhampshirensis]|uniref:Uncharacterized protein n=1 Tax=Kwoniella newhampshirensis TaxID=1651941 RepID=A0AAW0Z501_9TREE
MPSPSRLDSPSAQEQTGDLSGYSLSSTSTSTSTKERGSPEASSSASSTQTQTQSLQVVPQRPSLTSTSQPPSANYLGTLPSQPDSTDHDHPDDHARDSTLGLGGGAGRKGPPHDLLMSTGFASVKVGLGSPKLDFGRRDWAGGYMTRRDGSNASDHSGMNGGENGRGSPDHTPVIIEDRDGREEAFTRLRNGMVDRISGLPSPPGTESDIAIPPSEAKAKLKETSPAQIAQSSLRRPSPPRQRHSSGTFPQLVTSVQSASGSSSSRTIDSPQLHAQGLRPKHSPSISRSSPSSSAAPATSLNGDARPLSRMRHGTKSPGNDTSSDSQNGAISHDVAPSQQNGPPSSAHGVSPHSRLSTPERTSTSTLPPVSSGLSKLDRSRTSRTSSGSGLRSEEEDTGQDTLPRRASHGSELDERIREAEECILQASSNRIRRSTELEERATLVKAAVRRHDSYSRARDSPGILSSTNLRRSATLSSANANGHVQAEAQSDLPSHRANGAHDVQGEEDDRERSGGSGSGSSRRRKALPTDFRHGGLFTPSPQKPYSNQIPDERIQSSRSARLRHFIDSPTDYSTSSPIPNRFSSTSRLSREVEQIASPSRTSGSNVEGLPRSSSMIGMRDGETSEYGRRDWGQSKTGPPRDRNDLDYRGLPRERYRAESVIGGVLDGDPDHTRSITGSARSEREQKRRDISTMVSERDLASASRLRLAPIAPGDSVSAVGTKSDRGNNKDPLDVVRRLEEQRAQSRQRWSQMPRPATSMSSMRDVYNNPPRSAPIDGIKQRRSAEHDTSLSPSTGRGPSSVIGHRGPTTEPRPMRSSTSLGGRSTATLDFPSASSEHGRLLFEAFRALELRVGYDVIAAQPEMVRTLHSATRTSETINTAVQSAIRLASQIAVIAQMEESAGLRDEHTKLNFLLREAGRASDQNVRDITRIMLDLPKLLSEGSRMAQTSSTGSSRSRRSQSNATSLYSPLQPNLTSEERARRWQPTSPSATYANGLGISPLPGRWSLDTPRRTFDVLRPATSVGESASPLSSRYARGGGGGGGVPGSTVSSLMSKVRAMTPRKQHTLPPKPDLATIEQSPPQPQYDNNAPPPSASPPPISARTSSVSRSLERPMRNVLKKKASTASTNTIRGGSNFLPSTSRPRATTAISQVTAGDLHHGLGLRRSKSPPDEATSIASLKTFEDDPPSPMSRFSYTSHPRDVQEEAEEEGYITGEGGEQESHETDAVSMLEQRLVNAAKAREEGVVSMKSQTRTHKGEDGGSEEEHKRPSLSDRFRASLRKGVGSS